jgi:hypothetical protein
MTDEKYPKVHARPGASVCAACGCAYADPGGAPDPVGRDTAGRVNAVHYSCEVASGITLHLCLPIARDKVEALKAAWPHVLEGLLETVDQVKAEERGRLKAQMEAVN